MSTGSRARAHAKYATKHECSALLRSGLVRDRFTFITVMAQRMYGGPYKGADDGVRLAVYDVIWNMSERLQRRSP